MIDLDLYNICLDPATVEIALDYCLENDLIMPDTTGTYMYQCRYLKNAYSVSAINVGMDLPVWDFSIVTLSNGINSACNLSWSSNEGYSRHLSLSGEGCTRYSWVVYNID